MAERLMVECGVWSSKQCARVAQRVSQQALRELLATLSAFPHLKKKHATQHKMKRNGPQWVQSTFKRTSSDLQGDFAG
eukprot:1158573-Pelagomonas_calceolata.AAC.2